MVSFVVWLTFPLSDLVQLSALTSAVNVTEGILSCLRSLWPCGFCLVLYGSSILDNGWGKIKMFREWLVMNWGSGSQDPSGQFFAHIYLSHILPVTSHTQPLSHPIPFHDPVRLNKCWLKG